MVAAAAALPAARRWGAPLARGPSTLNEAPVRPRPADPPGGEPPLRPTRRPDPPLRSGGIRRHTFAPRARRGDPRVDLNFALDLDGFQERTLKLAYTLYESSRKRLEICARRRATGVGHKNLPLRPVKARPCGPTACNCTIDYRHLTAPNMMGIDASIVRATPQPAPPPAPRPPRPPRPAPWPLRRATTADTTPPRCHRLRTARRLARAATPSTSSPPPAPTRRLHAASTAPRRDAAPVRRVHAVAARATAAATRAPTASLAASKADPLAPLPRRRSDG